MIKILNPLLKVVTWNANSIKNKLNELKDFLYINKYDIVGICETKIDDKFVLKIPGYTVYNCNGNKFGGGVAIAVADNFEHMPVKFNKIKGIELVGVVITSNSLPLYICQAYIPPNIKLCYNDLLRMFCYENMLIMGDFNCRMHEWSCHPENANGKILLDFCIDLNIEISAPPTYTNFPPRGNPSIIDLFLFKKNLRHTEPISLPQLSSNHNPVEITLFFKPDTIVVCKTFDFEKADWSKFREQINLKVDLNFQIKSRQQIENKLETLNKIITDSVYKNIPIKPVNQQAISLPTSFPALIRLKNRCRKASQIVPSRHNLDVYKNYDKLVQQKIKDYVSCRKNHKVSRKSEYTQRNNLESY